MIRGKTLHTSLLPTWMWLIPAVAGLLLWQALQQMSDEPSERIVWYSTVIIIGTAALTLTCRAKEQFDLFEPLYLAFGLFLIFYPVRAILAVWLDESWFDPTKEPVWTSLSASALGFSCFAIGYKVVQRRVNPGRRTWVDRRWDLQRATSVSFAFLAMGSAGFVAMRLVGGSFLYFISLDSDIKAPGSISTWFFYLLWTCVFLQVGALVQLGIWLSSGRRNSWTILYCLLALLSTFLLSRYFTVLFLLMLALGWHYRRTKVRIIQVVALSFLVLGYLAFAGLYREWITPATNLEESVGLAELASQQSKLVVRYVVHDLEQFSNLADVISMTPSELRYQFGSTFTPILLKPVPRVLMPSKPLGASAVFSQKLIPDLYDEGLVTGLGGWGEWYLNFSWLGIVLGMALTGALTGVAFKAMSETYEFGRVLLYSSFVVALFTWLRNDFNSATTFGLYYFIPSVLALAYITKPQLGVKQGFDPDQVAP